MTLQLKNVLEQIKDHSIFSEFDFRLAGGTALSYRIQHRESEDLDFFINGKLPTNEIENFIKFCIEIYGEEKIVPLEASKSQQYEFERDGDSIDNYQQDWLISDVKITFFDCSHNVGNQDIFNQDSYSFYGNIKIMSVESIFKFKSLMFYKRVKIRDYFDLYSLYSNKDYNFTINDTLNLIQQYELAYQGEGIKLFLLTLEQKIKQYDQNYDQPIYTLVDNPPSFEYLSKYVLSNLSNLI